MKIEFLEGYKRVYKKLFKEKIEELNINYDNVDGVFICETGFVITGEPNEDDEEHNCDVLGCTTLSHVLYRCD